MTVRLAVPQAGLTVGLILLWVDYTSTIGSFPKGGSPPDFQVYFVLSD